MTLYPFPSLYLSRCRVLFSCPLSFPSPGALRSASKSGTLRDCQRLWRPAVRRSVPAPCRPCTPWSTNWIPRCQVKCRWGRNLTSCFSKLPEARPPPARTPLRVARSSESKREPVARPCRSRCPHRSSGGSPLKGDLGQVAPSGWAQWPRLQLLLLAMGLAPTLPSFPSCCSPRPGARAPLCRAGHCLTSYQATLRCAVPRSALSSGFIPLLGTKEEPRDKGPKLVSGRLLARAALS